jgi:hypothetical protein
MTHYTTTGGGEFRPGKYEVKTERTPVLDSPPRPWFNWGKKYSRQKKFESDDAEILAASTLYTCKQKKKCRLL